MYSTPVSNNLTDDSDAVQPSSAPMDVSIQTSVVHTQIVSTALAVEKTNSDLRMVSAVTHASMVHTDAKPAAAPAPNPTPPAQPKASYKSSNPKFTGGAGDSLGARPAAVAATAGGTIGGFAPVDTANDGALPSYFDPSVPSSYLDPLSYPGSSVLTKLYLMIGFMQSNSANKSAPQEFLLYISNLVNDPALMKAHPELMSLLVGPNSIKLNGVPIVSAAIDLEIDQYFFCGNGFTQGEQPFFDYLTKPPAGLFSGNDALSQMVQAKVADRQENWDSWVLANTTKDPKTGVITPNFTAAQFNVMASGQWGGALASGQASIQQWQRKVRLMMTDSVINKFAGLPPLVLLALLVFLLNDADTTSQITGNGATSNWLTKRTTDAKNVLGQWMKDNFGPTNDPTGKNAAAFLGALNTFQFLVDNSPLATGLASQLDSTINGIMGIPTAVKNPNDPSGGFYTIGELNDAAQDPSSGVSEAQVSVQLDLLIETPGSAQPPVSYSQISDGLRDLSSSVTDQSQTTAAQLNQLTSTDSAIVSLLQKILVDPSSGISALYQYIVNKYNT